MALSETNISSQQQQQQQQLPFSIESFTYSWCINLNPPSLESLSSSLRFSLDHHTLSGYFDIDLLDLEIEASDDHHDDHGGDHQPRGTIEICSLGSNESDSRPVMRKCKSFIMSRKILKRYLGLLLRMSICRKLMKRIKSRQRMSSRVDAIDDQSFNGRENWRVSCDSETSIHEAVLHCKRSIGDV